MKKYIGICLLLVTGRQVGGTLAWRQEEYGVGKLTDGTAPAQAYQLASLVGDVPPYLITGPLAGLTSVPFTGI
jgi:hypothetical protein